ncbi:MAG: hypothetical protein LBJ02_10960 [Bifidobacteriaceae bacterium]|jgi:hypothetical protein|nr:hypothetical protein [Bifidobacteriaceae bacterium]
MGTPKSDSSVATTALAQSLLPEQLAQIATDNPELQASVAWHLNIDQSLLEWLRDNGEPSASRVARVRLSVRGGDLFAASELDESDFGPALAQHSQAQSTAKRPDAAGKVPHQPPASPDSTAEVAAAIAAAAEIATGEITGSAEIAEAALAAAAEFATGEMAAIMVEDPADAEAGAAATPAKPSRTRRTTRTRKTAKVTEAGASTAPEDEAPAASDVPETLAAGTPDRDAVPTPPTGIATLEQAAAEALGGEFAAGNLLSPALPPSVQTQRLDALEAAVQSAEAAVTNSEAWGGPTFEVELILDEPPLPRRKDHPDDEEGAAEEAVESAGKSDAELTAGPETSADLGDSTEPELAAEPDQPLAEKAKEPIAEAETTPETAVEAVVTVPDEPAAAEPDTETTAGPAADSVAEDVTEDLAEDAAGPAAEVAEVSTEPPAQELPQPKVATQPDAVRTTPETADTPPGADRWAALQLLRQAPNWKLMVVAIILVALILVACVVLTLLILHGVTNTAAPLPDVTWPSQTG